MDEDKKNIFSIVQGGATEVLEDAAGPVVNTYVIVTKNSIDNPSEEYFGEGFLMPTSQHIMVMKETPQGALPVLLVPLDQVKYVELIEDEDDGGTEI